ncbi:MAG: Gfo/Idh/MocA family oxidoreductase [Armatimonadota bacterium]
MPDSFVPIVSIGAGGIVQNAHYPAYQKAEFAVAKTYDLNRDSAEKAAMKVDSTVCDSVSEAELSGAIYDLAVPGSAILETLRQLPDGAFVLIQKPLGETLEQAEQIVGLCDEKGLKAAVNFQLRWAPYMLALKDLIARNALGETHELEFKVNVHTPWAEWSFLEKAPRMEMVYHSIHYLDFIRHLWGEPRSVKAHSIKDPSSPKLDSSRSTVILDYGDMKRAVVQTYHGHVAPPGHQESYLRIEGTKGAAWVQMGLNMNYPQGGDDRLEYWISGNVEWTNVALQGSWFPDAFIGPMAAMMIWAEGGTAPSTEVHDALKTMLLVDAAYKNSDLGGILLA